MPFGLFAGLSALGGIPKGYQEGQQSQLNDLSISDAKTQALAKVAQGNALALLGGGAGGGGPGGMPQPGMSPPGPPGAGGPPGGLPGGPPPPGVASLPSQRPPGGPPQPQFPPGGAGGPMPPPQGAGPMPPGAPPWAQQGMPGAPGVPPMRQQPGMAPMQAMRPPPMQGGPPGAPPGGGPPPGGMPMRPPMPPGPGGPPPGGGQQPGGGPQFQQGMTWQQAAMLIAKANPGIKPEVLAEAVQNMLPRINQQSRIEFQQQMMAYREQQLQQREHAADMRDMTQRRGQDVGLQKTEEGIAGRAAEGFANREARATEGAENRGSREAIAGENRTAAQTRVDTQQAGADRRAGLRQTSPTAQAYASFIKAKPDSTPEEQAAFLRNLRGTGATGTQAKASELNPEEIDTLASSVANYQQAPYTASARGPGAKIMARAHELNPDYDVRKFGESNTGFKAFGTGKQGDLARFLGVVSGHIDTLSKAAKALDTGDTRALNALSQSFQTQFGEPAPTTFNLIKPIVVTEVYKAISGMGAGGVKERTELADRISAASSPAQMQQGLNALRALIAEQAKGLRSQYERTTFRKDFDQEFGFPMQGAATPQPGMVQDGYRFKSGDPSKPESWEQVQ